MVSSTHQRGWLSTTRTIFLLRIGATRGFRYVVNNIVTEYFDHGPNIFKTISKIWILGDFEVTQNIGPSLKSLVHANALTNAALARFSTSLAVSSPT